MDVLEGIIGFEWDGANSEKNWKKHRVATQEAEQVFLDARKFLFDDMAHSAQEQRLIVLGKTQQGRYLFVSFTIRNKHIRVISVRPASRKEVALYEEKARLTTVQK